jgi:transcriptional regulator with XRE-family HTH domain
MEEWEQFRTLLRDRLKERGALARLAKTSGINSPVIGRWERGESRPSPANLERLAPSLGVPYEELLKMAGFLPGKLSTDINPQLASLIAHIESGWLAMDEATRELAERGSEQLKNLPLTSAHFPS